MIFYFTGTGNSLHAARAIAQEGEQLINMAEAVNQGKYTFTRRKGERIGFVFPEYCGTVPRIVSDFVRNLTVLGRGYCFALVTCGGVTSTCGGFLRHMLAKRGIPLYYKTHIRMPSNASMYMDVPSKEECAQILRRAEKKLARLSEKLRTKPVRPVRGGLTATLMRPVYRLSCTTKPYHAEDTCTGCGKCARNCPDQAISMQEGKPVWVKGQCTLCGACINRCPVSAIQFGKGSKNRGRYVHPDLK